MIRSAYALIRLEHLSHNLNILRKAAPHSRIMAVVKADAYGHGLIQTAQALNKADAFAVASANEAVELRSAGILHPIICLQGFSNTEQLQMIADANVQPVIHSDFQVKILHSQTLKQAMQVWLKIDTGMSRLGVSPNEALPVYEKLSNSKQVSKIRLMTHFAKADELNEKSIHEQLYKFTQASENIPQCEKSAANSAAALAYSNSQLDWIRPGLALYGISPYQTEQHQPDTHELLPVMSLRAPLISIKTCKKGDQVGYGGSYTCTEDTKIGIVAMGYADGYPRSISTSTYASINGKHALIIGRVSMDMIALNLNDIEAEIGTDVELWGDDIPVSEVAQSANTLSYELLCAISNKVERRYI